jgi:hypothetical protein
MAGSVVSLFLNLLAQGSTGPALLPVDLWGLEILAGISLPIGCVLLVKFSYHTISAGAK